jgi:hypothetical protein
VWVYTRDNGVWTQQGSKLVVNPAFSQEIGASVALSADGNTALVGGPGDIREVKGGAWIFTRSGGIWTQQGELSGNTVGDAHTNIHQGWSVALSADGKTAIEGAYNDDMFAGAAWVFPLNGVGTQQKLVGTGAVGQAEQGWSVSLSGDGNTATVGGLQDGSGTGAVWVYTRSNGVWTQQGSKLVGPGSVGNAGQGQSVALSGDSNTAIIGGGIDMREPGRRGSLPKVQRCKSPQPPIWSPRETRAVPSPLHHSNIS